MAKTLNDIIFRRTTLGELGDLKDEQIELIASIAKKELNWTDEQKIKQIALVMEKLKIPV